MLDQLCIPFAQFFLREAGFPDEVGAARNIQHNARKSFVHRRMGFAIPANPGLIAERLCQRLTQRQRAVFGGVVLIDVQIARDLHRHIDQRMAAELFDHVIEKADPGVNVIGARAIEIHLDDNVGFLGFALYSACSHRLQPIGRLPSCASRTAACDARISRQL